MPTIPPDKRPGAHGDAATSQDDQEIRLHQMQERIAELSTEARSIRAQLPHDCGPDVESVQKQMEFLGDRLAELNAGSTPRPAQDETAEAGWGGYCNNPYGNSGEVVGKENKVNKVSAATTTVEQHQVVASNGSVEPADPWDEDSAAALVELYESGEANLAGGAREHYSGRSLANASATSWPTPNLQSRAAPIEPARLEQRFAEIAQRVEGSLSEIRPESSLSMLGHRFDQLEERIISALDGFATRADVEELRQAEGEVEEIGAQIGQFREQLSRLDSIDTHLETLTQQLSDEKIAKILSDASASAIDSPRFDAIDAQLRSIAEQLSDENFSGSKAQHATPVPDLEGLAASAAEQMAERLDSRERWEEQSRNLGEVRGLVENLIKERRINDENNANMLETMQQAIIRVFDRIDALEIAQQSAAPAMAASELAVPDTEAEPIEAASITENDSEQSYVSLTHPQPEPADLDVPSTFPENETEHSSYVSLTHPQPQPSIEAERAALSESAQQESTYVSLTHPQQDPYAESDPCQDEATADLGDEMIYEPPPFLQSESKPTYIGSLDDRQDKPYTPPGSLPISEDTPLASSAFFADTSESNSDAKVEEIDSSKPTALSIDEMRQNLIAEAHRAKLRAASAPEGTSASQESIAANEAGEASKTKRGLAKLCGKLMPSASNTKRGIVVGALALMLILPAAFFLLPRSGSDVDGALAPEAVHSIPSPQGAAQPGATQADTGVDVAPKPTNNVDPGAGSEGGIDKDAMDPAPKSDPTRVDTASIPHGIMLLQREQNSDEILRAQQAQGMAFLSNQLGISAANATPASVMQEYILAQQLGPKELNGQAPTQSANSLQLPPATVGPFSLRMAAAQGIASAQFEVAARLAKGDVTDQNLEEAARWYRRSASQGFAMAQYRLGSLYERGLGMKADLARAQVWYRRAALQGNLKAMHNLAVLSAGREGRTPDYTAASQWFLQAAERGLAASQYNLAMLYESGLGVRHDLKQAYKWFVLASKSGDTDAERRREALAPKLGKKDRAEAEKLANSWRAKASDPMLNDARVAGQAWQHGTRRAARG